VRAVELGPRLAADLALGGAVIHRPGGEARALPADGRPVEAHREAIGRVVYGRAGAHFTGNVAQSFPNVAASSRVMRCVPVASVKHEAEVVPTQSPPRRARRPVQDALGAIPEVEGILAERAVGAGERRAAGERGPVPVPHDPGGTDGVGAAARDRGDGVGRRGALQDRGAVLADPPERRRIAGIARLDGR